MPPFFARCLALTVDVQTSRKVMMVLSQDVTFDVGELRSLNALFKKQCFLAAAKMRANSGGDGGDSDLELDEFRLAKLEFCDVVCEEYPSLSRQLAMQLFDSFDEDNSGEVDLKEFTIGLLKVAVGTTPEKLELVFQRIVHLDDLHILLVILVDCLVDLILYYHQ